MSFIKFINLYFDLDGVLVDFNGEINAVDRFENELDFFFNLKQIPRNVNIVKKLIAMIKSDKVIIIHNYKVKLKIFFITSSPNSRCDNDKIHWMRMTLPEVKRDQIIIIRNGQKKVKYMKTLHGILLDDYGKNCREWAAKKGNISCKITSDKDVEFYLKQLQLL